MALGDVFGTGRCDQQRRGYTGALCGLGPSEEDPHIGVFPDYDLEIDFDFDFDDEDLETVRESCESDTFSCMTESFHLQINTIRLSIQVGINGDNNGLRGSDDLVRIQDVSRSKLLKLVEI